MKIFYFVGNCGPKSEDPVKRVEFALIRAIGQRPGWTIDSSVRPSPGLEHYIARNHDLRIDWRREQAWERNAQQTERICTMIDNLERTLGISLRRCIYADRSLNRMYTRLQCDFPASPMWAYVRAESTRAEKIVHRYFVLYNRVLDEAHPDAVVTHSFAGAPNLVVALLCEYKRIPYFNMTNASTTYQRFFVRQHYLFHHNPRLEEAYRRHMTERRVPSAEARAYIEEFQRANAHYIDWERVYEHPRLAALSKLYIIKQTYLSARNAIAQMVRHMLGAPRRYYLSNPLFLKKQWYWLRASFNFKKRIYRIFQDYSDKELAEKRYVYLPLHQDPEEMLMTGAPIWGEALSLVDMISKMIPFGYRLFVRDHIDNVAIRPQGFYEHLAAIPGVVLVTPVGSAIRFIKHADLVITIHGSTGWEGLLMKRPVITLNNTFYDITGLTHKVRDINVLDRQILEILKSDGIGDVREYERKLGLLIDADRELSFAREEDAVNDTIARIEEAVGTQ